jgi:predicted RND superfamily exporter protein
MAKEKTKTKISDKVVNFIIGKGELIEIVFGVAIALSLICIPFVKVNYDFSKYLPTTTESRQGIEIAKKEFGFPGTARVMIEGVTLYQAKMFKDRFEAVDGVDTISWADTPEDITKLTDVYQSSKFINMNNIKDYYKDGYTVMDIAFDEDDYSLRTSAAIDKIKEIVGEKGRFAGAAVQTKSYSESINKEASSAMVYMVLIIALILTITTTAWFEPVLFLLVMGIAIVINMGTNIILGEISFFTFSLASVLQLAVAMDYSIFLLHTFTAEKEAGAEPSKAIAIAIRRSSYSILACGFATIIGFLALTLMEFSIGLDLGIVLAKGIFISMLTVLLLMPSLIVRWSKLIEKTAHRPFLPSFDKAGQWIVKMRYVVLIISIVIALPSFVAKDMNSFLFGNAAVGAGEGTKAYEDDKAISSRFGSSNIVLAVVPNTSIVKERQLSASLEKLDYVNKVASMPKFLPAVIPENILPESITSRFHSKNYARMIVFMNTDSESDYAFKCSDEIKSIVNKYYPKDSYVTGTTPFTQDTKTTILSDNTYVDMLSLLGVAIVAMIAFRSILIPVLLLIPIEIAIFVNMAIPYLMGDKLVFMGYLIVGCIQLAATVDYSILMSNHYLESRSRMDKKEAILETITATAPPILTSGMILGSAGYVLSFTSSISAIAGMGQLIGRGTFLSMLLVVVLLPALLHTFDKQIYSHMKRIQRLKEKGNEKLYLVRQKASNVVDLGLHRNTKTAERAVGLGREDQDL